MVQGILETELVVILQEKTEEKLEMMIQMMLIHFQEGVILDPEEVTTHDQKLITTLVMSS